MSKKTGSATLAVQIQPERILYDGDGLGANRISSALLDDLTSLTLGPGANVKKGAAGNTTEGKSNNREKRLASKGKAAKLLPRRNRLHAESGGLDRHVDPMLARRDETGMTARLGRDDGPGALGRCQNLNQSTVSSETHGGEFFRKLSLQTLNDLGAVVAIVRGGRLCLGAQGVPADTKDGQDRGNTGSHDKLLSRTNFLSREKGHPPPSGETRRPAKAAARLLFLSLAQTPGKRCDVRHSQGRGSAAGGAKNRRRKGLLVLAASFSRAGECPTG